VRERLRIGRTSAAGRRPVAAGPGRHRGTGSGYRGGVPVRIARRTAERRG
jgi:hypothetical protein